MELVTSLRKQPFLLPVSRAGTSTSQRQKFHTDDVNQCLHNTYGSHEVPHPILVNFTFLLFNFIKVLCSNDLQQNSNASSSEKYTSPILTVLLEIHRAYI